jgi:hypothetical protein
MERGSVIIVIDLPPAEPVGRFGREARILAGVCVVLGMLQQVGERRLSFG